MVGCVLRQLKPSELYIPSFEKSFSKLRMYKEALKELKYF